MPEADRKSYHHLRSDVRFPTDFRAVLHWGDNFSCVQVANIASTGMRFIGRALPELDAKVRITASGLEVTGRIVWRTPHSCAVTLERAIEPLAVVRANCFARHLATDKRPLDRLAQTVTVTPPDRRLPIAPRQLGGRSPSPTAIAARIARLPRRGFHNMVPI